jgi:hypothetical protein
MIGGVNNTFTHAIDVADNLITDWRSGPLRAINASTTGVSDKGYFYRSSQPRKLVAQMDDGTHNVRADAEIAPTESRRVAAETVGEYSASLRGLTKRFTHIAQVPTNITFSYGGIFETESGFRTYKGKEKYIPDSWMSIISYLYRFYAGGKRYKTFLQFQDRAQSSITAAGNAQGRSIGTSYDEEVPMGDPSVETSGVINNAVEIEIPYYNVVRARVLNGSFNFVDNKLVQRIDGPDGYRRFYEAGADDLNFWFMVGPPVMTPTYISRVEPPNMSTKIVTPKFAVYDNVGY